MKSASDLFVANHNTSQRMSVERVILMATTTLVLLLAWFYLLNLSA